MTNTAVSVGEILPLIRREAGEVAAVENLRVLELLRSLRDDEWTRPTDCPKWDVRAMAGHILGGMEAFASVGQFFHQMRAGAKAKGDGPFIDGMTAVQVRERAALTRVELLDRLADVGPRVARARARIPRMLRWMPMKEEVGGVPETWKMGYLLDVILTRDTWMHRLDIARATGREMVLTSEHDGRIVADVVAEWARRHGQPFALSLEGLAGGAFCHGDHDGDRDGEEITIDAIEFCRILSGRATGVGLLAQEVPF